LIGARFNVSVQKTKNVILLIAQPYKDIWTSSILSGSSVFFSHGLATIYIKTTHL